MMQKERLKDGLNIQQSKTNTMIKGTKETLPDIIAAIYAAIDKIAK